MFGEIFLCVFDHHTLSTTLSTTKVLRTYNTLSTLPLSHLQHKRAHTRTLSSLQQSFSSKGTHKGMHKTKPRAGLGSWFPH